MKYDCQKPIVCPKCGNKDMDDMRLTIVDLNYESYTYLDSDDELPLFGYSKNVHYESSDNPPMMKCTAPTGEVDKRGCDVRCYKNWEVSWNDFDIG